jgi:hypothetical protein
MPRRVASRGVSLAWIHQAGHRSRIADRIRFACAERFACATAAVVRERPAIGSDRTGRTSCFAGGSGRVRRLVTRAIAGSVRRWIACLRLPSHGVLRTHGVQHACVGHAGGVRSLVACSVADAVAGAVAGAVATRTRPVRPGGSCGSVTGARTAPREDHSEQRDADGREPSRRRSASAILEAA